MRRINSLQDRQTVMLKPPGKVFAQRVQISNATGGSYVMQHTKQLRDDVLSSPMLGPIMWNQNPADLQNRTGASYARWQQVVFSLFATLKHVLSKNERIYLVPLFMCQLVCLHLMC